jgi:hypothetical protein
MTRVTVETSNGDNGGAAAGVGLGLASLVMFWVLAAPAVVALHLVALGANIFFDTGQVITFSVLAAVVFLAVSCVALRKPNEDAWTALGRGLMWWGVLSVGLLAIYLLAHFGFKLRLLDDLFYRLEFPFSGARRRWGVEASLCI